MTQTRNFPLITSLEDFRKFLIQKKATMTRTINHLQYHCTWRPTLSGYLNSKDKEQVIRSMWVYHTQTEKWSDIGQNFTFSPDGIWVCRDLNTTPAGILNHNYGGICVEMIGDFDKGREVMSPEYEKFIISAFAILREVFPGMTDWFHRELVTTRTCPGSALDKATFVGKVHAMQENLRSNELVLKYKINDTSVKTGVLDSSLDYYEAISILNKNGVINSPNYWTSLISVSPNGNLVKSLNVSGTVIKSLCENMFKVIHGAEAPTPEVAIREMGILGVFTTMGYWTGLPDDRAIPYDIYSIVLRRCALKILWIKDPESSYNTSKK